MTTDLWAQAALVALSYLAGGIPTGYLVVRRLLGIDIRDRGSGNPGAANVYRVAGAEAGAVTLLVDALKGFLPVLIAQRLYPGQPWFVVLCGTAAIVGHDWTVFLGFRGGKGVATSAGVFAALTPQPMSLALMGFLGGMWASGHISMGSLCSAAALPLLCLLLGAPHPYTVAALAASLLIVYKHIPNIKRLRRERALTQRLKGRHRSAGGPVAGKRS
ncbi:MAG: glycerol-3-phosphate 1-O-acyltransferase PlsY [Elusimicrobia bacterium]|nr:glycerol-3-phosphate 1-O-acyltransferase PlsY [Elusimicrobiota bacterium]